ncbi:MAG: hypothetical protein ACRD01_12845 [Terriglobales bacterium]
MVKTTVYLEESSYRALKQVAARRKQAPAALIRLAVVEFARAHGRRRLPSSLGRFRSGRPDLGSRAEQLLGGFGE